AGQQNHRAQRARLTLQGDVGVLEVAPDLAGDEGSEQGEQDAERRQHPWREALEPARSFARRERHHDQVDQPGDQECGSEDDQGEPGNGQVVEPVAHSRPCGQVDCVKGEGTLSSAPAPRRQFPARALSLIIWTTERGLAAGASDNFSPPLTQGSVTTIPVLLAIPTIPPIPPASVNVEDPEPSGASPR